MHIGRIRSRNLFCLCHDVQRVRRRVDDWRPRDANFGRNVATLTDVTGWNGSDSLGRTDKVHLPQRSALQPVGVESKHAVMLRSYIDDIPQSLSWNIHIRDVQRRSIRNAIQRIAEQLSKLSRVYVGAG